MGWQHRRCQHRCQEQHSFCTNGGEPGLHRRGRRECWAQISWEQHAVVSAQLWVSGQQQQTAAGITSRAHRHTADRMCSTSLCIIGREVPASAAPGRETSDIRTRHWMADVLGSRRHATVVCDDKRLFVLPGSAV
eukprot:192953-Rhodomonas_salina.1